MVGDIYTFLKRHNGSPKLEFYIEYDDEPNPGFRMPVGYGFTGSNICWQVHTLVIKWAIEDKKPYYKFFINKNIGPIKLLISLTEKIIKNRTEKTCHCMNINV